MTAPVEGTRQRYTVEGVVTRSIAGGRIVYLRDDNGDRHTFRLDPLSSLRGGPRLVPVEQDEEAAS